MIHSSPGRELRTWHSEARVEALFAETLLLPPLPCGAFRYPQPGESPWQKAEVFSMQIGSQMGAVVHLYFLGEAVGWEGSEPSQAMHWSLSAWPLCRCHSDSCGRTGFWRCCPQDRVHHLMGQGRGTSSGWLGCRERETGSGPKNTSTLGHQALFKHFKTQMFLGQKDHTVCSW